MNIFVSGLSSQLGNDQLKDMFSSFGDVSSGKIVMDRETGRSRGFGFVVMPDEASAAEAMKQMNGRVVEGKALVVNQAHPKEKNNFR